MLFGPAIDRANTRIEDSVVVEVSGPMTSANEGFFDSYLSIRTRVLEACLSDARQVVLFISSPGGEVHGAFEASRAIQQACLTAGKDLVAYIDDYGCSAAYALACGASRIVASETATVGSIGVIAARYDVTEAMARDGIRVSYTVSGTKKAFGNPELPQTDAEKADTQHQIDVLAGMFFDLVAANRGLSPEEIAAFEAGVFLGREAQAVGLIDEVASFDSLFMPPVSVASGANTVSLSECIEALEALAEGDDEDADQARRMLGKAEDKQEDDKPADDGDKPADDDKDKDKAAIAASAPVGPDFSAELAALRNEIEALKAPKAKRPVAVTTLPPPAPPPAPVKTEQERMLDIAFGLEKPKADFTVVGNVLRFPVGAR